MALRLLAPRYWPTWLGLGVLRLAESLPYAFLLGTGRVIGRVARRLPLHYVRVARRNIEICLPELDARQRETLLDKHFESLGIGLCESAMCWWSSDERVLGLSHVEGMEHLEQALAAGRGAVLLTAHFTTLEIGARILNSRVPINILYRPLKNELLASVSARHFERQARKAILKDDVRGMVRALKRNEIVWYAPDQSYRKKGAMMIPFFGREAATNVFTSRLAQMTGAAVLYFSTERLADGSGYRAVIHPAFVPDPQGCAVAETLRYHACIEKQVREMPEQYWWIHRRFKGLAEDFPDAYAREPVNAVRHGEHRSA